MRVDEGKIQGSDLSQREASLDYRAVFAAMQELEREGQDVRLFFWFDHRNGGILAPSFQSVKLSSIPSCMSFKNALPSLSSPVFGRATSSNALSMVENQVESSPIGIPCACVM
jgi:hypothetical protein